MQDKKNGIIASSRGPTATTTDEPLSAKPAIIRDSFNGTSKVKGQMADLHQSDGGKPKCPQTCVKTNDKKFGLENRKSDLVDYKNAMSMTQVDAHIDFVKKRGEHAQQLQMKRKPVSALNEEETGGAKTVTSGGPPSIGAATTGSIKKQISMAA